MYVHPLYRGRGINKIIIEELKRLVQERGVTELRLEVFSQNEPAIKAYEKVGFTSHIIQMRMSL
jgi:ribosomal protein S18 acetylase RimI-like enzyme